jgi:HEAT repeat protein
MRDAKPAGYAAIEAKLLDVLRCPDATEDAKTFVCRCLRQIGSAKCVPVVAPLLTNEKLSHMARYALQGNPSPAAGKALRDALGSVKGNLLVGMISSVGARRDSDAVGTLASLAKGDDATVAGAAMSALGRIGGAKAAAALQAMTPPAALQKAWASAALGCAESLSPGDAGKLYRKVYGGQFDTVSRVGALAGLVRTGNIKADELVAVLKGSDAKLQIEAAQLSAELRDKSMVQAYVKALPSLPASAQVIVISGFASSGNKAAAGAVASLADSSNVEVSGAALRALGVIGDASNVPSLMQLSLGKDDKAALAFASLTRLPGAAVDAALAKSLKSPNAGERAKAIEAFAARMDRRQNKAILAACSDSEKDVRMAAYKALRALGDDAVLPALTDLLVSTESSSERGELEQTVTATALRSKSADAAASVLIGKFGKSADADASLLSVLAKRGGAKALEAVRKRAAGTDPEQKKAAVRAMSAWADIAPLNDLMAVAQNDSDAACRTLALRGYVRLVADSDKPVAEKVKMFESALAAAKQPDAVKQILSGVGNVKEIAALKVAVARLEDATVANEAAAAALSISQEQVNKKKSQDKAIVDALTKIQKSTTVNEALRKQAAALLKKMSQPTPQKKQK